MSNEDEFLAKGSLSRDLLSWQTVDWQLVADCEIFSVIKTVARSKFSKTEQAHFHTIKCFDWVNIIALTENKEVLIVEQYRHGIRDLCFEIPGGCIDEGEEPLQAAMRELKEETGYSASNWHFLGKSHPNPALQDNYCYAYLAQGARKVEEPTFDKSGNEKLSSILLPLSSIDALIERGKISHSLVITAFHLLKLKHNEIFD